jgi:hypothetical protein
MAVGLLAILVACLPIMLVLGVIRLTPAVHSYRNLTTLFGPRAGWRYRSHRK